MKKLLLICQLLIGITIANAQLKAGDIAIIALNEDAGPGTGKNDGFTWIALTDIPGDQEIYFSEEGWNDNLTNTAQGFWQGSNEGHIRWTAPSGGLSCGTVVFINEASSNTFTVDGGGMISGIVAGTNWSLFAGDQILVYTSASGARPASTVPTFITAFHMDDNRSVSIGHDPVTGWSSASFSGTSPNASHLPPGLTNGVNAMAIHGPSSSAEYEQDNAKFTASLTGNSTDVLARIYNLTDKLTNWSRVNSSPPDISPSSFSPNITCAAACSDPDVPTVTYSPNTVCAGGKTTLSISGSLNDATEWKIYTGSCGGTLIGSTFTNSFEVTPASPSTTYYVRGEGGCITPGSCGQVTVTVTAKDDASFSYGASSFCKDAIDPSPTVTGLTGGSFSSTSGLSIASSGTIDVSASTANTYTVTYTTAGTCPNSSTASVTINNLDDASFSYGASSFCKDATDPSPTITGLTGGSFSSTSGLSIASSGTIDVSASTANTYTVTYTTAGTCPNSSTASVTINNLDDASFSYGASSFCKDATDPSPTITGLTGGSFSSTSGLSIASNGTIDASASTANTYTVTYTTAGTCPNTSTQEVSINSVTDQTVTAATSSFCTSGATTIDLGSSETGVAYYLRNNVDNSIISGPVIGTGSGLSLPTSNITATTTYNVYGHRGIEPTTLAFDGVNDRVLVNTGTDVLKDAYTVEAWVKPNTTSGAMTIFSTRTPGETSFDFKLQNGNLIHGDIGTGSGWINTSADASFTYVAGQWYHIAYTVSTTGYTIYANGVQVGTGSFANTSPLLFDANHPIMIGGYNPTVESFNGNIDEVRVWSTTRTAQEILDNYKTAINANETGLVAYYNFGDGTGSNILSDLTANGYSGILSNMDPATDWVEDSFSGNASCGLQMTTRPSVTINNLDNAGFSYSASNFCKDATDPSPTVTGLTGGSFSSTSGLSIASNGTIDVSASTANTYTVTYTTAGTCPNSSTTSVTINNLDDASFSYGASSFCKDATDPSPTVTGLTGGSFSSTSGLSIASNGTIDVSASTANTYTVTYTTAGTCPNSSTTSVTINNLDDASFSYGASSFCKDAADPSPTVTGLTGGSFSSTSGLSIASSGTIDVSASTANTYTVTYTTAGTCPNSSTASVTINNLDDASFSYGASSFCKDATDPSPTITGLTGGSFSSTSGLSIASNGTIDVSASTANTYTVTYTTAGTCSNSSTASVTINTSPTPTITGKLQFCPGGSTMLSTDQEYDSYTWSNGAITKSAEISVAGDYFVIVSQNGCNSQSPKVTVTQEVCTALFETESGSEVQVFPNPISDGALSFTTELTNISILTPVGEVVLEKDSGLSIDVDLLAPGMYILLSDEGKSIFIKE